jgi:hypothetical protein
VALPTHEATSLTITIHLRVTVADGAVCRFSYSLDGKNFLPIGNPFNAREGNGSAQRWASSHSVPAKPVRWVTRTLIGSGLSSLSVAQIRKVSDRERRYRTASSSERDKIQRARNQINSVSR